MKSDKVKSSLFIQRNVFQEKTWTKYIFTVAQFAFKHCGPQTF